MKKNIILFLIFTFFTSQTFALNIVNDKSVYNEYVRDFSEKNIFSNIVLIPEKNIFKNIEINEVVNNISYTSNSTKDLSYLKFTQDLRNQNITKSYLENYLEDYTDFEEVLINKLWEDKYNNLIKNKIIYKAQAWFKDKSRSLFLSKNFFINSSEDKILKVDFSPYDEKFIWSFNLSWEFNRLWEEVITPKIFIYWSEFEPRYFINGVVMEKYYKIIKNKLRDWKIIYRVLPFYKWNISLKKWENKVKIWALTSIWNLRFDNTYIEYPSITF